MYRTVVADLKCGLGLIDDSEAIDLLSKPTAYDRVHWLFLFHDTWIAPPLIPIVLPVHDSPSTRAGTTTKTVDYYLLLLGLGLAL